MNERAMASDCSVHVIHIMYLLPNRSAPLPIAIENSGPAMPNDMFTQGTYWIGIFGGITPKKNDPENPLYSVNPANRANLLSISMRRVSSVEWKKSLKNPCDVFTWFVGGSSGFL